MKSKVIKTIDAFTYSQRDRTDLVEMVKCIDKTNDTTNKKLVNMVECIDKTMIQLTNIFAQIY